MRGTVRSHLAAVVEQWRCGTRVGGLARWSRPSASAPVVGRSSRSKHLPFPAPSATPSPDRAGGGAQWERVSVSRSQSLAAMCPRGSGPCRCVLCCVSVVVTVLRDSEDGGRGGSSSMNVAWTALVSTVVAVPIAALLTVPTCRCDCERRRDERALQCTAMSSTGATAAAYRTQPHLFQHFRIDARLPTRGGGGQ